MEIHREKIEWWNLSSEGPKMKNVLRRCAEHPQMFPFSEGGL